MYCLSVHLLAPESQTAALSICDSLGLQGYLVLELFVLVVAGCKTKPLLPLVSAYLNKSALEALVGPEVKPPKHFELRKKLKSEDLREELLRKSKLGEV